MTAPNRLADGRYLCMATLVVKDGKAVIVLNDTFGLPAGATIPLLRTAGNLVVEELSGSSIGLLNGHSII